MEATKLMCFVCFEALENKVTGCHKNIFRKQAPETDNRECPMFVTWKKNGNLRGCIGIFKEIPLWDGLQEYAVIAGTQDRRFSPIIKDELPKLDCGISLLHSFEPGNDVLDWTVGKHGIRLFIDGYSATYLPEVASEQGWTKEEALRSLARKAGYPREFGPSEYSKARIERYQSAKLHATWEEYEKAQQESAL
ncbi:hypothetical protein TVAG_326010 [Trichomonas vaginalis G3]|uniref:AMMECR1 domain-containing protein n=1 Tax=Trichomonas vaginalis (strain ATCC PRA-98 / G3) TaxID=412133 RepID=A2G8Q7_TRIV3|nr:AMMECR1 family [Trichomonas vaginalis G3]EAX86465.1 hypothetical protein TVAG_326010 [Trichomonas vaginalis G3]KAI5511895.1 AMMECR1 family [Trichomonas vaginalis G3]|eukprot:XP_001299395.1 hypothetical protein [Trichomonas vaginalis G3]